MTRYNVHIYREMRLFYEGIEADSHESAASIARDKETRDADDIEDCNGDDLGALIDVAGDDQYEHSRLIDFEPEWRRKAAPRLLAALQAAEGFVHWARDHGADRPAVEAALAFIRTAIAEAEAAGISSPPAAATGGGHE